MPSARAFLGGLLVLTLSVAAWGALVLLRAQPAWGAGAEAWRDSGSSTARWDEVLRQYQGREAESLFWRGVACANLGRLEESRQAFVDFETSAGREEASAEIARSSREGLSREPNGLRELNGLAFLAYDAQDYAGAVENFRRIVRLDPGNPWVRAYLGFSLGKAGRLDEGVAVLEEAVRLFPQNEVLHFLLGLGYYHKGQIVKALLEMAKAPRAIRYFR